MSKPIEVAVWNCQTCTAKKGELLLTWATRTLAIGLAEWRASWPISKRLQSGFKCISSDNNDLAWLLPPAWQTLGTWAGDGWLATCEAIESRAEVTLVIVHLSCESRGRAVQEAELAAWAAEHLKGAWVLGGDFNTVEGEESEALRRALRSAGGRVGANSLPTHFRTQVQVEVEGYTARNLDRIWSSMCGGTWELVDTRGLSDHKMVRLVDIAVPAADDWVLSSFKRRRIGEDVIVRCQKGRLREWVGASQWVKPSCATGWEALVWRVERLRAAGMTSVVVPQIEKMARERGEGVGNPFKTLNEWINEIRTGRLAALAGGPLHRSISWGRRF